MQIIRTSETSNISVPSREFTNGSIDLSIEKESIRDTFEAVVTASYDLGVMTFDYNFEATEGSYLFVVASQNDAELVKFKVYCTDQTDLQNYSIDDGLYNAAPQPDNSFNTI